MSLNMSGVPLTPAFLTAKTMWNVYRVSTPSTPVEIQHGDFRPAGWEPSSSDPRAESLMLKASNINEQVFDKSGDYRVGWFFDAFLRESHNGSVKVTEHPVQGGANISDHAYNLPDRLTIEIYVSDVMDSVIFGQFSSCETKSISAYAELRRLKEQRQLLSIRTRLHYYENMVIESMTTNDDHKHVSSLRCTVIFRQVLMAQVATEVVSAEPLVTKVTNNGNMAPKPVESGKPSVAARWRDAFTGGK